MVTENGQSDGNTSFLRAARNGQLDKVLEYLKSNIDINTSNANGLNALHLASKDGHLEIVEELLKRGAVVDAATKKGNTALHIASLAGQEEVVKLLVQHGASVNVQSQNGFTPLYMAAQENHDNVVKYLLANGANQSLSTEDGFTPLAVAMQQGHDKVVAVLLENDTRGKVRLPALHIAAKKDDVKAAKLLLENDHNADVTSKSGFTPLHIASHYGNQQIANLLIQKNADVNYAAKHNITPLHVAAKWGKTNMVSLLLENGATIEAKTRDGLTPLHCAARSGHEQVVDMLLERGAPISSKTKNGLAPLHMAAQGDHVDAARILLYHRAPVDEVTVDYLTALHVAAHCGHVRVAKLLLDRQADANARALNGFTPLHIACKKNRIKVVELLLKHGGNISATTESGLTPLHVASFMGCMNIVIYLLQHDANPDAPTVRGETPLHLAARANQTDIIRILLRNGAQVDVRAREQQTPLHIASRLGNADIVALLLQHGAKVDNTTKDMYTALHIAAKEGQDEVASLLWDNGASLHAVTKKGFTPLHLAAKYGHLKVAKFLLKKEAPVDAQGKNGVTPLHVALHYDHQDVASLLLDKGASPHSSAKNGHTPLHIAARKNQMDIANTLLEYGANPNAESKAGFTPLHLSAQEGHSDMTSLLLEHKANVNSEAKNGLTPLHLCAQEDRVSTAEVLTKNGVDINAVTKSGYTPLHIACHYGQMNMVRFLLENGAKIESTTSLNYTPLHQAAQQGQANIVNVLLDYRADPDAVTTNGQTPLMIAQKLGYITVIENLKLVSDKESSLKLNSAVNEEKYRVQAPELMHETFMSDSEEEGGEDTILGDHQTYRYLTADEMKSLGDDSLPIDVTRDERIDSNRMVSSMDNNSFPPQHIEDNISPEHITQNYVEYISNCVPDNTDIGRYPVNIGFLVSFLVDARGGAMRGCRHSGVRVIVPPRCASSPTRITCRYVRPQRTPHPPPLMEGEALASRVLELGPVGAKFLGPVIIEVPHFAALRDKEREIVILRSDNGENWKEHTVEATEDILSDVLRNNFEAEDLNELEDTSLGRITRIVTQDFPQYFAVVSRIRQEVHAIGPEGGMVSSTVVPQVQAVFPEGALTKKIKVGLQAQPIDPELTAKLLGHGVAVSPVVTVEPRRRKFHKAITLTMPAPKAHSQGMINQYSGSAPTLRLLCSITGGTTRAQWEDVTGSTPLTFVNDCVSFTTTVSARFWLMDCRNISDATKMATELYKEAIHVPFMAKFVVFAKRVDPLEARLRVFCMTDDKEDKTLEQQEHFTEVAKSRDVEVLEGKLHYIEFAGNLVPVTKSGEQLSFCFRAFKENRLPFTVRVKDQHAEAVSRCLFMKEPKVPKGEPPQQPICILNIVLPDDIVTDTVSLTDSDSYKKYTILSDYYRPDPRIADMSNLLGDDWVPLANQLGLTISEINVIKSEYPESTAKQAQSMLRMWLSQSGNYAQMNTLENALRRIGREDIITHCINVDQPDQVLRRINQEITSGYKEKKDRNEEHKFTKRTTSKVTEEKEGKRRSKSYDKYSAEEKEHSEDEVEEEEEEESFDIPVSERRQKIEKRLSAERAIPASAQRKEIVQEITSIKQQNLVEDKLAEVQQKVFEHEEKSKIVLPKPVTTTKVNNKAIVSEDKSPPHIIETIAVTSETQKTDVEKLMKGITQRLEEKTTTLIAADEAVKSPKFSKTPPPSPADFLFREQEHASQDSDADDNFESKVLKYKRKKRRNVSKAITDTEDLDLSDDEITTRNRHKRNHKKSSIPKTVSLNFDREDEECVFSTNNIKEKRKVVNNSEFDSKDFCSDTDDFVSLMGEITDFCSQVKDAGSNIKRFDSDIETSEELEELEDANGISTPPEKVKPPLVRNLTIFSEKNGVPTVTIFPLEDDHIEDDFTVDNIPTEEESISDIEEFSENYGSTVNPETDLIKSKKRKPPTFKSLYEKQNKLFMKETPIANIVDTEDIFVDEIKTDDFEMKTVYSMKKISNENKIVDEEIEKASNINQNENVHNEESDFKVSSQQEDDKEEKGDSEAISNSQECNEIEEAEEATDTKNLDESDVCRQTNSKSYGNECGIRDDSSVQNVESSTEEWETQQKDELRSNKLEENAEKTDVPCEPCTLKSDLNISVQNKSSPSATCQTSYAQIDVMLENIFSEIEKLAPPEGANDDQDSIEPCKTSLELKPSVDVTIEVPIKKCVKVPKKYTSCRELAINSNENGSDSPQNEKLYNSPSNIKLCDPTEGMKDYNFKLDIDKAATPSVTDHSIIDSVKAPVQAICQQSMPKNENSLKTEIESNEKSTGDKDTSNLWCEYENIPFMMEKGLDQDIENFLFSSNPIYQNVETKDDMMQFFDEDECVSRNSDNDSHLNVQITDLDDDILSCTYDNEYEKDIQDDKIENDQYHLLDMDIPEVNENNRNILITDLDQDINQEEIETKDKLRNNPNTDVWWEGIYRDVKPSLLEIDTVEPSAPESHFKDTLAFTPYLKNLITYTNIPTDTEIHSVSSSSEDETYLSNCHKNLSTAKTAKADVKILVKSSECDVEIRSVRELKDISAIPKKLKKKSRTLPGSSSEILTQYENNFSNRKFLSEPSLLQLQSESNSETKAYVDFPSFTLPTLFEIDSNSFKSDDIEDSSKNNIKLLPITNINFPLQCDITESGKVYDDENEEEQAYSSPLLSSGLSSNLGEKFQTLDAYCDWLISHSDNSEPEPCNNQLTEATLTLLEPKQLQPLPKPRAKPTEVPQHHEAKEKEVSEKPKSPVRDDLLDDEIPESYSDKKKFWENVTQDTSQKRYSMQETSTSHRESFKKKQMSVQELSTVPVPKPRTLHSSQSLIEKEIDTSKEHLDDTSSRTSSEEISLQDQKQKRTTFATEKHLKKNNQQDKKKKISTEELVQKGSGPISDNFGYISDSEDVEHYISDSEIEDRVPQIRDRMMSVFVPSASSTACRSIYERSASLPTEDLYEVSARTIKARKEYYEEQIRKEMIEEQLTSELEEEPSPEKKKLLISSTEEDHTDADAKSIADDMEDIREEQVPEISQRLKSALATDSKKEMPETTIKTQQTLVCQKNINQEQIFDNETTVEQKLPDHTEPTAIRRTTKTEPHFVDSTDTISKTDNGRLNDELRPEDYQFHGGLEKNNENKLFETQQSVSSDKSGEHADEQNFRDDSHSTKPDSMEVLVDKSEIEDSEKLAELDHDLEAKSEESLDIDDSPKQSHFVETELKNGHDIIVTNGRCTEEYKQDVESSIKLPQEHVQNVVWEVPVQSHLKHSFSEKVEDLEVQSIVKIDDISKKKTNEIHSKIPILKKHETTKIQEGLDIKITDEVKPKNGIDKTVLEIIPGKGFTEKLMTNKEESVNVSDTKITKQERISNKDIQEEITTRKIQEVKGERSELKGHEATSSDSKKTEVKIETEKFIQHESEFSSYDLSQKRTSDKIKETKREMVSESKIDDITSLKSDKAQLKKETAKSLHSESELNAEANKQDLLIKTSEQIKETKHEVRFDSKSDEVVSLASNNAKIKKDIQDFIQHESDFCSRLNERDPILTTSSEQIERANHGNESKVDKIESLECSKAKVKQEPAEQKPIQTKKSEQTKETKHEEANLKSEVEKFIKHESEFNTDYSESTKKDLIETQQVLKTKICKDSNVDIIGTTKKLDREVATKEGIILNTVSNKSTEQFHTESSNILNKIIPDENKSALDSSISKPPKTILKTDFLITDYDKNKSPVSESSELHKRALEEKSDKLKGGKEEKPSKSAYESDNQREIEKIIFDCLQQQKVDPEEAQKIANALVEEIEAEIQKHDSLSSEPIEKIEEKANIPEFLRHLAEAKGLDQREVELVESVLARKKRGHKLARGDTQASSLEITDEDLKYSGTEMDYSQEQQMDQLEAEKISNLDSESFEEPSDNSQSKTTFIEKTGEEHEEETHWLQDFGNNTDPNVIASRKDGKMKIHENIKSEKIKSKDENATEFDDKIISENILKESELTSTNIQTILAENSKILLKDSEVAATTTGIADVQADHILNISHDTVKVTDNDKSREIIMENTNIESEDKMTAKYDSQIEETEISRDSKKQTNIITEEKYDQVNKLQEQKHKKEDTELTDDGSKVNIKDIDKNISIKTSTMVTHTHQKEQTTTVQEDFENKDTYSKELLKQLEAGESKTIVETHEIVRRTSSSSNELKSTEYTKKEETESPTVVLRKSKSDADTSSDSPKVKPDRKSGYDYEINSSSGESHYQSFEIDSNKSRPCSSDVEGLLAAGSSEYESALTSQVYSARSQMSTDYKTVSSMSSKDSMKSLDSESSGNLASVEISEHSETLVPSTSDLDDILDSIDQQLLTDENELNEQNLAWSNKSIDAHPVNEISDSEGISITGVNESIDVSEEESPDVKMNEIQSKMKRSCEMTFQPEPKVLAPESPHGESEDKLGTSLDDGSIFSASMSSTSSTGAQRTVIEQSRADSDRLEGSMTISGTSEHLSLEDVESIPRGSIDSAVASSTFVSTGTSTSQSDEQPELIIDSVTITTSTVDENGIQSVCTQVTSGKQFTEGPVTSFSTSTEPKKKGHKRTESTVLMGSIPKFDTDIKTSESEKFSSKLLSKEDSLEEKKITDEICESVTSSEVLSLTKEIELESATHSRDKPESDIENLKQYSSEKIEPKLHFSVKSAYEIDETIKDIDKKSSYVESKEVGIEIHHEKKSAEEGEAEAVFSMVSPISPGHKAKQICPILEEDVAEKHELESHERLDKGFIVHAGLLKDASPVPDIKITQHMAPLVDNNFRYPDLELESKEKQQEAQTDTPQTPASNSSKSSEETDQGREYVINEPVSTIPEEPEGVTEEEVKIQTEDKSESKEKKGTDSPDSSESFEMLDKPDLIDDFVVIEEVGKEAHELDAEGKSVKIAKISKSKKKHDEEIEQYLARSDPTPLTKMTELKYYPDGSSTENAPFDFEDSPPQIEKGHSKTAKNGNQYDRELEANRKWIEQQFQGDHASMMAAGYGYEMEFERGPLEDIKEEDITDFAASSYGSQKDSGGSVKESYSSTPEYDVLAGRKYFTRSGEHDDTSMSSLQEFENLEQAMSLEMRKLHQGSQDSSSNGSFKTRYIISKSGQGDDISVSSLKEFEGLEKACIAAHKIEVKVKEEEALLAQIEEGQESIASESESCETVSGAEKKVATDNEEEDYEKRMFEIDEIIKQAQSNVERFVDLRDVEKTESLGRGDSVEEVSKVPDLDLDAPLIRSTVKVQWKDNEDVMATSTDSLEQQHGKPSYHGSTDSLDQETGGNVMTTSTDSIEMQLRKSSKDNIISDSIEAHCSEKTHMVLSDSLDIAAAVQQSDNNALLTDSIDEDSSKFGPYEHSTSSTGKDINSSVKDDFSNDKDYEQHQDNIDISSSAATHATYQYETDSVISGSFTSGGSNTMVSSTNSLDQGRQGTVVDIATAVRKVWFDEESGEGVTTEFVDDSSKPYVTEIIEPSGEEYFSHVIRRKVELPPEVRKITFTGADADEQMQKFLEEFNEGEECVETEEIDSDGNIHIKKVVTRRVVVKDDGSQPAKSEIEEYFRQLNQPDVVKGKGIIDAKQSQDKEEASSSQSVTKPTRDNQEVSTKAPEVSSTSSVKASRRRPLRYEISVEDQTEVDPREHDWRFNLPKHAFRRRALRYEISVEDQTEVDPREHDWRFNLPNHVGFHRRPLLYEISVEDQTEVDPREHDWRFNLTHHVEGEEASDKEELEKKTMDKQQE